MFDGAKIRQRCAVAGHTSEIFLHFVLLEHKKPGLSNHSIHIIQQGGIRKDYSILFDSAIAVMCMAKEMISRLYVKDSISKRCITPMSTRRTIEYHYWRLMSNNDIRITWNQLL